MEKSIVAGDSITSIATILGRSRITIYSEIKRGSVVQIRQGKACIVYVADSGQLTYEQRRLGSFNAMKLGNIEPFICWIEERVYKDHWSFDAAIIGKTITVDNGLEFADISELEDEILSIYFAHSYSAWERGSNERHNGLFRRFIPKGK